MNKHLILKKVLLNAIAQETQRMFDENLLPANVYKQIFKKDYDIDLTIPASLGDEVFEEHLTRLEQSGYLSFDQDFIDLCENNNISETDISAFLCGTHYDFPQELQTHKSFLREDNHILSNIAFDYVSALKINNLSKKESSFKY